MPQGFHEEFNRSEEVKGSSNRVFGLVFAVVFGLIGLWPLLDGAGPRWWALVVSGVFLLFALVFPQYLAPLNSLWTRFGLLLHRIVSPVVLGLIFAVAVTPVALILRLCGKDPLQRRFEENVESYWIVRSDAGPPAETMRNQF